MPDYARQRTALARHLALEGEAIGMSELLGVVGGFIVIWGILDCGGHKFKGLLEGVMVLKSDYL